VKVQNSSNDAVNFPAHVQHEADRESSGTKFVVEYGARNFVAKIRPDQIVRPPDEPPQKSGIVKLRVQTVTDSHR